MKCPSCGSEVPDDSKFCPYCGEACGNKIHCPECQAEIDAGLAFCPQCGASLKQSEKNAAKNQEAASGKEENQATCPVCQHVVPRNLKFCPYCGAMLVFDQGDAAPAEPAKKHLEEVVAPPPSPSLREQKTPEPQAPIPQERPPVPPTSTRPIITPSTPPDFGPPTQPPTHSLSEKQKRGIVIGAVVLCLLGGGLAWHIFSEPDQPVAHHASKQVTQTKEASKQKEKKHADSELCLDEVYVGEEWVDAQEDLGRANSSASEAGGRIRYKFDDMEVVVKDGIVEALVSSSSSVSTKRGIHQGDSKQEVFAAYGTDYQESDYDTQTYYEYPFETEDGTPTLLRFAIDNSTNKVDYISIRVLSDDISNAKKAFLAYHEALSAHQIRNAFNRLSPNFQNSVGGYDGYAPGYQNTLSSTVTDVHLLFSSPSRVEFSYQLKAKDRVPGDSRAKVQTFNGQVTMINDNGTWYIDDMSAKKEGEYRE